MAVLPTPASPTITGLFLVRRVSICITRLISLSRPITGSSLPRRASSVRSRAYFSRERYLLSALESVTRCPPRMFCRARYTFSWSMPKRCRMPAASPFCSPAIAINRCSMPMNSSLSLLASAAAASTSRVMRGVA
ncbi:hypothetical protein ES705_28555 [subsurface metagenome]